MKFSSAILCLLIVSLHNTDARFSGFFSALFTIEKVTTTKTPTTTQTYTKGSTSTIVSHSSSTAEATPFLNATFMKTTTVDIAMIEESTMEEVMDMMGVDGMNLENNLVVQCRRFCKKRRNSKQFRVRKCRPSRRLYKVCLFCRQTLGCKENVRGPI